MIVAAAGNAIYDVDGLTLGLVILRVAVGIIMLAHGINHIFRGGKIAGTAGWFSSLGMKPGILHAWLASLTEVGAGAMLVLGSAHPAGRRRRGGHHDRRPRHQPPQERLLHLPSR